MKKLIILCLLVSGAFVVWGTSNPFQNSKLTAKYPIVNHTIDSLYATKYKDCIILSDFPEGAYTDHLIIENDWDLLKVNASINRYGQSLDLTIKSLNAIDAHDSLHQEFERSKNIITNNRNLSWIRTHYHHEIMRICYERDKLLNLGSRHSPYSL